MASLSEYLMWRGDITFEQVPMNVVDALLLAQLSYLDLRGIIGEKEKKKECTLAYATKKCWQNHPKEELEESVAFGLRSTLLLAKEMVKTERFSKLILRNYVNRIDEEKEKQFSAVEILLREGESFISYSGTDDTIVGWKEDFNMCYLSPIPSQRDARIYLEHIFEKENCKVHIGGHSKGGNLAVYAAVRCHPPYRDNILGIYNFDGPGFSPDFIEGIAYQAIKDRIQTWVPESSVIGMLLENEDNYKVVKSNVNGFQQHDVASWEVQGTGFIVKADVKKSSRRLAEGLKEWMQGLRPEELEYFGDRLYELLLATEAQTLAELNKERWKSVKTILSTYNTMDKKVKEMLFSLIKVIVTSNLKVEFSRKENKKEAGRSFGRKQLPKNSR